MVIYLLEFCRKYLGIYLFICELKSNRSEYKNSYNLGLDTDRSIASNIPNIVPTKIPIEIIITNNFFCLFQSEFFNPNI